VLARRFLRGWKELKLDELEEAVIEALLSSTSAVGHLKRGQSADVCDAILLVCILSM
jgi:hypothetical protein